MFLFIDGAVLRSIIIADFSTGSDIVVDSIWNDYSGYLADSKGKTWTAEASERYQELLQMTENYNQN